MFCFGTSLLAYINLLVILICNTLPKEPHNSTKLMAMMMNVVQPIALFLPTISNNTTSIKDVRFH